MFGRQVSQRTGVVHTLHPVRLTTGRVTTLVDDDRRWCVHVEPSPSTQAGGEVDVLEVHEVTRIEAPDGVERRQVNQEAGTGQPPRGTLSWGLSFSPVARRPPVRRPGPAEQRVSD